MKDGETMEQSIGEVLRRARQAKGYTLEDLQQITKIQKRYLIAIEENEFEILPGNFYTRAFIKQVAEVLGLDGETILAEYTSVLPQKQTPVYEEPAPSKKIHHKRAEMKSKRQVAADKTFKTFKSYLPTILLCLLALAIVFAIGRALMNHKQQQVAVDSSISTAVVQSESSVSSSSSSSTVIETVKSTIDLVANNGTVMSYSAKKIKFPAEVTVKNTHVQDLWAAILVDGVSQKDEIIPANGEVTLTVQQGSSLTFTFGYEPNATITINGTTITLSEETAAQSVYITFE